MNKNIAPSLLCIPFYITYFSCAVPCAPEQISLAMQAPSVNTLNGARIEQNVRHFHKLLEFYRIRKPLTLEHCDILTAVLSTAIMHNDSNAVRALLEAGACADCDLSKIDGATYDLPYPSMSPNAPLYQNSYYGRKIPPPYSPTPLCLAARSINNPHIIQLLIQAGADICKVDNDLVWPVLVLAIQEQNEAIALELLSRGSNTHLLCIKEVLPPLDFHSLARMLNSRQPRFLENNPHWQREDVRRRVFAYRIANWKANNQIRIADIVCKRTEAIERLLSSQGITNMLKIIIGRYLGEYLIKTESKNHKDHTNCYWHLLEEAYDALGLKRQVSQ